MRRPLSTVGVVAGVIFFAFSLTPTLIPRAPLFQAVASGMSLISGYAVGATLGWLFRKLGFRLDLTPGQRRRAWLAGAAVAIVVIAVLMALGARWQNDIRALMGMEPLGPSYGFVVVVALLVASVFLFLARLVRWAALAIGRLVARSKLPQPVARLAGGVIVAVVVVGAFDGLVYEGLMSTMEATYSVVDQGTAEGVFQPVFPERSGSPESPVAWETLVFKDEPLSPGGEVPKSWLNSLKK